MSEEHADRRARQIQADQDAIKSAARRKQIEAAREALEQQKVDRPAAEAELRDQRTRKQRAKAALRAQRESLRKARENNKTRAEERAEERTRRKPEPPQTS